MTLSTVAHQALLSMRFSRQEYWSWLPFPSPGDPPDPGIKLVCLTSNLHWQAGSLPLAPPHPHLLKWFYNMLNFPGIKQSCSLQEDTSLSPLELYRRSLTIQNFWSFGHLAGVSWEADTILQPSLHFWFSITRDSWASTNFFSYMESSLSFHAQKIHNILF